MVACLIGIFKWIGGHSGDGPVRVAEELVATRSSAWRKLCLVSSSMACLGCALSFFSRSKKVVEKPSDIDDCVRVFYNAPKKRYSYNDRILSLPVSPSYIHTCFLWRGLHKSS